jgi:hypothetical protein
MELGRFDACEIGHGAFRSAGRVGWRVGEGEPGRPDHVTEVAVSAEGLGHSS